VRVRVDASFGHEATRFDLRFTCRDCALWAPAREACAHEWPNADHLAPPPAPPEGGHVEVVFCKEFELG
jgi:hypothetical protein